MGRVLKLPLVAMIGALALLLGLAAPLSAATAAGAVSRQFRLAQAMVPPTGMMDAQHPMPMNERMLKRFPQAVRVGDLLGLPVLDQNASTLGYVRQVVRTPQGEVELIVSYSRWWGWFGRPVAVPIEAVGIEGRQLVSLDMPPSAYGAAPIWQRNDAASLPADAIIRVALARG
jgi:sporulation protein YlmC with PRC-barrel domain